MSEIPPKPTFNAGQYAAENRAKVRARLAGQQGILLLIGASILDRKWTDVELKFRQESNFYYMTGIQEPGFSLTVDITSGQSNFYMPNYDSDYSLWHGSPVVAS
jgi:Xaa-Pro dipeptidase